MATRRPHNGINETIHQRTRLSIMATLAGVRQLDFSELKARLALTDGNLSTHLAALERADYVRIHKSFKGKKPRTTVAMTAKGKAALKEYVAILRRLLEQAE